MNEPRKRRRMPQPEMAEAIQFDGLTPQERRVLSLLAQGKASKHIAAELRISIRTAECYRHRMLIKTGAQNAAHLCAEAVRAGLI